MFEWGEPLLGYPKWLIGKVGQSIFRLSLSLRLRRVQASRGRYSLGEKLFLCLGVFGVRGSAPCLGQFMAVIPPPLRPPLGPWVLCVVLRDVGFRCLAPWRSCPVPTEQQLVPSRAGTQGEGSKAGLRRWDSLLWDVLKAERA